MDGHPPDDPAGDGTAEPPSSPPKEGEARTEESRVAPSATESHDDPDHADEPAPTAPGTTDDRPPVTTNTPTAPETPTPASAGVEASAPGSPGEPSDPSDPAAAPSSERAAAPRDGDATPDRSGGGTGPDAWGPPTGEPRQPGADTGDDRTSDDAQDDASDGGATTVVLGGVGTAAQPPPPAPRLSPDAVAATTSTRTTDPHGIRALRLRATPPGGVTRVGDAETEPPPRHLRGGDGVGERRRSVVLLAAAPVLIVVLFLLGWAIDSAALSGQVMRNVEVAGRPVGGLGEASLPEVMSEIAEDAASRPVQIVNGDRRYETTAGAIGLTVDEEATADAALDAGRNDAFFVRPFKWLGSFFGSRDAPVHYTVSEGAAALTLAQLQGNDATAPQEPRIELGPNGEFIAVPGHPGVGIDAQEVAADLPAAAEEDPSGSIVIDAENAEVQPQYTDEAAAELAAQANEMTANGLTLRVEDTTVQVAPAQLRNWIGQAPAEQGFELAANGDLIRQELPGLFRELAQPQNASVTLGPNGRPQVTPGRNGITCCNDDSVERIWNALNGREREIALEGQVAEPEVTTEEAEAWQIREPVGGNRAWRDGAAVGGPAPGFTTYHQPGEPRVTNIHRIADLVRGAVIPPDGTFSINDHVGQRTTANGFVEAGAIRNGQHVPEVGGGVSQFATTTFNAAYFAGLDIVEYQAHTEWFSRYPRGREATMGYPSPDLKIHNNTPYGILIWTSYTDTSVTVTLYSTPYIRAEQTGSSESAAGPGCTTVETTRTRTWIDGGRTDTDAFRATYRNQAGIDCQGRPIPPPPEDAAGPR